MPTATGIDIVDLAILYALYALADRVLPCSEVSVVVAASELGLLNPAF